MKYIAILLLLVIASCKPQQMQRVTVSKGCWNGTASVETMLEECLKVYQFKDKEQFKKWSKEDCCGFRIVVIGTDTCYVIKKV